MSTDLKNLCQLKALFKTLYRLEARVQSEHGLSINEALTLCTLSSAPRSAGELASELGASPSRVSRIVGSLERKGFVRRSIDNDDKRKMILMLTENGVNKIICTRECLADMPDLSLLISEGVIL